MSINRVSISGNITRDPELRQTAGGMPILSFGVAVNERRKNQKTGEWENCSNFVDCVMFGKRAEAVSRFLTKGAKVAVDGRLRYSSWEKDGQRRSKLEVIVDELDFFSRGAAAPTTAPAVDVDPAVVSAVVESAAAQINAQIKTADEDIPF